jgi:hypothetical protein
VKGSSSPSSFTPIPLSTADDRHALEWYSLEDVAKLSRRAPSTIRNIISKYGLRHRSGWQVYRRRRRRVMMLSPNVARWIQGVTLFRQPPEYPPR